MRTSVDVRMEAAVSKDSVSVPLLTPDGDVKVSVHNISQ